MMEKIFVFVYIMQFKEKCNYNHFNIDYLRNINEICPERM